MMSKSSSRYGTRAGSEPDAGWDETPFTSEEYPTDSRYPGFVHGMAFEDWKASRPQASGLASRTESTKTGSAPAPAKRAAKGPTAPQMDLLKTMFAERTDAEAVVALRVALLAEHKAGRLTFAAASDAITWMKREHPRQRAQAPAQTSTPAPQVKVPEGRYALPTAAGHLAFYQVEQGTGNWEGKTFIVQLVGAPGSYEENRLPRNRQFALLEEIAKDAQAAAAAYGKAWKVCGRCHAELSQVQSRAAGYGQTCATKSGFWYPSHAEALTILGEGGQTL